MSGAKEEEFARVPNCVRNAVKVCASSSSSSPSPSVTATAASARGKPESKCGRAAHKMPDSSDSRRTENGDVSGRTNEERRRHEGKSGSHVRRRNYEKGEIRTSGAMGRRKDTFHPIQQ